MLPHSIDSDDEVMCSACAQAEVEALRGEACSGRSSPMAWDGHRLDMAAGGSGSLSLEASDDAAMDVESGSQASSEGPTSSREDHARREAGRPGSWTSQRSLEAQVAALRQQLDVAAATQVEQDREIALLRAEGGAAEVQAAVAVAVASLQRELAATQRHCNELQSRMVSLATLL